MDYVKHRVTIGLPVFNGGRYLKETLDSILSQTYQDFKIIISDNASTDETQTICLDYAGKDSRITYYRNKKNYGVAWNFNRTFKLSSSDYFKWANHDDLLATDYLEKCVKELDKDPSIALCHCWSACIDENSIIKGYYQNRVPIRLASWKLHERFGDLISRRTMLSTYWALMGVLRSSSLRKTRLLGDYIDADRNLLAEIGLEGRIYEIPEYLFFRRDHSRAYTNIYYSKPAMVHDYRKQLLYWTGGAEKRRIVLPHWKNCIEYFRSVGRAQLQSSERYSCYEEIGKWIIGPGWRLMQWDLANEFKLWLIRLKNWIKVYG